MKQLLIAVVHCMLSLHLLLLLRMSSCKQQRARVYPGTTCTGNVSVSPAEAGAHRKRFHNQASGPPLV